MYLVWNPDNGMVRFTTTSLQDAARVRTGNERVTTRAWYNRFSGYTYDRQY